MDTNNTKTDTRHEILSWIWSLLIVAAVAAFILIFLGQRTRVEGSSMYPTLEDKDNLIADKLSYRFNEPERFDIVVFPYKYKKHTHYIKRIIGLPGETVQIKDGKIYIDGELLDENYGAETINDPGRAAEPIVLGEDEYFVMGDNRNHSSDSRYEDVGNIKKSDLTGRAWVRIFPFRKFGNLYE